MQVMHNSCMLFELCQCIKGSMRETEYAGDAQFQGCLEGFASHTVVTQS